jgi:hypothetical protein
MMTQYYKLNIYILFYNWLLSQLNIISPLNGKTY